MPKIYLSAGEASGDRHAAELCKALKRLSPKSEVFGMGGDALSAAGCQILQDIDELAVMGFAEVIAKYPTIKRAFDQALDDCVNLGAEVAVLVDYPGFHMRLARELKRRGVPVVLYIAPQVWAWKPGRVHKVKEVADKLLVIFDFEVELFEKAEVNVEFVGHPLLDEIDLAAPTGAARKALGIGGETPLVALFPGSRKQVRSRLLPVYIDAAKQIRAARPDTVFVVGTPDGTDRLYADDLRAGDGSVPAALQHDLLRDATCCMLNSGTMSLEAAIIGCPGIIGYRTSFVNYLIAKSVVTIDRIGLPNLVLGQDVMKEFYQRDCNPRNIAVELLPLIAYPERHAAARRQLLEVRKRLGGPGASERAAKSILDLLC